ncbi:MAG TPA: DUF2185 domain-containing protein [Candidatus Angelobacter sp.]|nr:DUF2185 domain-containing protein [Candidatus Angelobacter sp.]
MKKFALAAPDIRSLAPGRGSCFASDRITIDRRPVGFMYREPPDNDVDSGWRFLSGEETQEYVNNPANFAIYDVNTIANYDPAIILYLDAPAFSAFERNPGEKQFARAPFPG